MTELSIHLLGRLQIYASGRKLELCKSKKALELLCLLLLRDSARKSRELIASELWPQNMTEQSKAYLRRVLWELRRWFDNVFGDDHDIIRHEDDSLYINPELDVSTDTAELLAAARAYEGVDGANLSRDSLAYIEGTVTSYRGDLLENWYEDWLENWRDSFKSIQFTLLDKIIDYCVAHRLGEKGLLYCTQVHRLDPAREKSHRAKMRLLYDAGRRIDALRQYEHCCNMLSREFDIKPSQETEMLREVIARSSDLGNVSFLPGTGSARRSNDTLEQHQTY